MAISVSLDCQCSRHSLQDRRQYFGFICCSPTLKDEMAAAWSSCSLLEREHLWRRGCGLLLLTWNLLYNLGQEELSRTTQGGTQASNAALRLARAQGKDWSAWVTAIHYPMRSPRRLANNAHRKSPDAGWGEWDRDNLRLPGPPAPGSSRGHGSLTSSSIYFCHFFLFHFLPFLFVLHLCV